MAKIMPVHVPHAIEPEKAAEVEHVMEQAEQATASHVPAAAAPDPYLARSVKSSPNGF